MATLKLTSDTLAVTPAGGEIEYNGQFFGADSNNSRAQFERITLETSKTASGTSVDFTGIPAWVKKITVMLNSVSLSGTSAPSFQLGTSGGIVATGYDAGGTSVSTATSSTTNGASSTTLFPLATGAMSAASLTSGFITFSNILGNTWVGSGTFWSSGAGRVHTCSGTITLSSALTQVRITTLNGTDTYDAGSINILYEG